MSAKQVRSTTVSQVNVKILSVPAVLAPDSSMSPGFPQIFPRDGLLIEPERRIEQEKSLRNCVGESRRWRDEICFFSPRAARKAGETFSRSDHFWWRKARQRIRLVLVRIARGLPVMGFDKKTLATVARTRTHLLEV